jgi:hypothetical protein
MHRRHALIALWGALALAAPTSRALAQSVEGAVTDRDGATPVSGVLVLLIDSAGTVVSRDLSRAEGRFKLRARALGTHTIRALRIGFTPTLIEPFAVRSGETRTMVRLDGAPVRLDAIRVTERPVCRVRPDSTQDAFRVWEEVRKALAATVLSTSEPYVIVADSIHRKFDVNGRVANEGRSSRVMRSYTPYVAIDADSLERVGYVHGDSSGTHYYAPDADILLSSRFADTHCLKLVRAPSGKRSASSLLGIEFSPATPRPSRADIEGVLWIDARSAELRELEFRYVNVPRAVSDGNGGGRVTFLRLSDGAWIIRDWMLRMPVIGIHARDKLAASGWPSRVAMPHLVLVRIEEVGGVIISVKLQGRTIWGLPSPTIGRARPLPFSYPTTVAGVLDVSSQ